MVFVRKAQKVNDDTARCDTKQQFKNCSDLFANIGLRLVMLHSEKIERFTKCFKMGPKHLCHSGSNI
jgi:hypothetical protein